MESAGVVIPEDMRTMVTEKERMSERFLKSIKLRKDEVYGWLPQDRQVVGHFLTSLVDAECDYDVGFDIPEPPPQLAREECFLAGRARVHMRADAVMPGGEEGQGILHRDAERELRQARGGRVVSRGRGRARGAAEESMREDGQVVSMLKQIGKFLVKMKNTMSCMAVHYDKEFTKAHQNMWRLRDPACTVAREDLQKPVEFVFPQQWPYLVGAEDEEERGFEESDEDTGAGPSQPGTSRGADGQDTGEESDD